MSKMILAVIVAVVGLSGCAPVITPLSFNTFHQKGGYALVTDVRSADRKGNTLGVSPQAICNEIEPHTVCSHLQNYNRIIATMSNSYQHAGFGVIVFVPKSVRLARINHSNFMKDDIIRFTEPKRVKDRLLVARFVGIVRPAGKHDPDCRWKSDFMGTRYNMYGQVECNGWSADKTLGF